LKKQDYYIYHQSFIAPLLNGFKQSGASLDKLTSKCIIKKFDFEDPEAYLPMNVLYDFFKNAKADQGINNLATTFYSRFEISELGEYGEFLTECPDLLTVLLDGIKYNHLFQTNSVMNIEVTGATSRFTNIHLEAESEERQIAERIEFAMILNAFRMVLGEDWIPLKIEIPGSTPEWLGDMLPLENINIQSGRPYFAVVFNTNLLAHKNECKTTIKLPPNHKSLDSLSDCISTVLNSTTEGSIPYLADFSNYFNMSERTIIRSLDEEGIKFSSLIERFLFTKSLKLLTDDRLSVNEISQKLGYSNTPNFLRAFKKWTNNTPTGYRLNSTKLSTLNGFPVKNLT